MRVTIAGRTWYLSSESCAPEQDGTAIPHHGSLEVGGFVETISWAGGGVTGPCTADVSFHLGDVEGWTLIRDGHRLESARAEVSLWTPGTPYAARWVLVTGKIECDEIPQDGEPFEATVKDTLIENAASWPPVDDVITASAWPNAPADDDALNVIGEPYPWPLGVGGSYVNEDGDVKRVSKTPMIIIDDTGGAEIGAVAGAPVAATTVRIWNRTHRDSAVFPVSTTIDGDGVPRATVSLAGHPGGWTFDGSEEYFVSDWSGGGLLQDRRPVAVEGLGDACLYLLSRRYDETGPERIDYGAWMAEIGRLNAWRVFLNPDPGDPVEVISGDLCALCPGLYIMGGPAGLRPVLLRMDPDPAAVRLEVGRDLDTVDEPSGFVEVDPLNGVLYSFARSASYDVLRGKGSVGRADLVESAAGLSRHGPREETMEFNATDDRATADLAAREHVRLRWTRPLRLVYTCSAETARQLPLGSQVLLIDADRGLTDQRAHLIGRESEDGDTWTLNFALMR